MNENKHRQITEIEHTHKLGQGKPYVLKELKNYLLDNGSNENLTVTSARGVLKISSDANDVIEYKQAIFHIRLYFDDLCKKIPGVSVDEGDLLLPDIIHGFASVVAPPYLKVFKVNNDLEIKDLKKNIDRRYNEETKQVEVYTDNREVYIVAPERMKRTLLRDFYTSIEEVKERYYVDLYALVKLEHTSLVIPSEQSYTYVKELCDELEDSSYCINVEIGNDDLINIRILSVAFEGLLPGILEILKGRANVLASP